MRKLILAILFSVVAAFGQSTDLTFEVASVKPAAPLNPGRGMMIGRRGGPGTNDPGRINWNNTTLKDLLMSAYDVKRYQITGPDWLESERFDLIATLRPATTKEQANVMLQNLLTDRFGIALHHTSKEFQAEELTVTKTGSKLKEYVADPKAPETLGAPLPPGPPKMDKNGFPELAAPGLVMMMTMGPSGPNAHMVGKGQTADQLATAIGRELNRPVVDKTGLRGKYDFNLEFAPDPANMPAMPAGMMAGRGGPGPAGEGGPQIPGATDPSGMTIVGAVQQQLGLKLTSAKTALDVIVIDRASRVPTDN